LSPALSSGVASGAASPEDKAGLKARLLERVASVGHADVRSLYRRELLARFDAFAYPRRQPGGWPRQGKSAWTAPPPPSRPRREAGSERDALIAAVIAGLLRHPAQIAPKADSLARLSTGNARLTALIDLLVELGDSGQALEAARLAPILAARRLAAPSPSDHAGIRFAFLTDDAAPERVAEELGDALAMLVERPALQAAKDRAAARFAEDPEGATAEMKRLRERELVFEARMRQRASARAGAEREANGRDGGQ